MIFKLPHWLRVWKKRSESDVSSGCKGRQRKFLKLQMPRTEILILLVGLACTVFGKLVVVQRQNPPHLLVELLPVLLPDFLFFSIALLFINGLCLLRPSAMIIRLNLLVAGVVCLWSVLNAAWLIASGVQLQPGIMFVLLRGLVQLWPIAQTYLVNRFWKFSLLAIVLLIVSASFVRCFYRPGVNAPPRAISARKTIFAAVLIVVLIVVSSLAPEQTHIGFAREVLGFSSHWQALVSLSAGSSNANNALTQSRSVPRIGHRQITAPSHPPERLPNVVIVLLESISDSVSLDAPAKNLMPQFVQLADKSVRFKRTYTILPYTTKAFWAVLTGTTPTVQGDYVEAVRVHPPYEGLPSILRRVGYRSAFFEMSKGNFECAPGFFANLDFDWAWFRENLGDPSAYLGYMGGDDCRMIKPAFEWVSESSKPFFLMMITSVSHDPYEVPAWFGVPPKNPHERYIQTVRYTDYFLEQLCEGLKNRGLDKNTILCILGDHGTSFRVQQGRGRWVPYEEVLHVPWVIYWPGHIQAGKCVDWPCSQLDVTPTILKLIGFDIAQAGFEGKDAFVPSEPNRRLYFSSWYPESPAGFVEGNRKVVYWPYLNKVFEFDLAADPNEESPKILASEQAEQAKQDVLDWQSKSRITIDAKRHTEEFLFSHWQTFSVGRSAWAYYVP